MYGDAKLACLTHTGGLIGKEAGPRGAGRGPHSVLRVDPEAQGRDARGTQAFTCPKNQAYFSSSESSFKKLMYSPRVCCACLQERKSFYRSQIDDRVASASARMSSALASRCADLVRRREEEEEHRQRCACVCSCETLPCVAARCWLGYTRRDLTWMSCGSRQVGGGWAEPVASASAP